MDLEPPRMDRTRSFEAVSLPCRRQSSMTPLIEPEDSHGSPRQARCCNVATRQQLAATTDSSIVYSSHVNNISAKLACLGTRVRTSVEFRLDDKRNYRSLDTETTLPTVHLQNATRCHGTRVSVSSCTHTTKVRHSLRQFSQNCQKFIGIMSRPPAPNFIGIGQKVYKTVKISFTLSSELWFSFHQFPRNFLLPNRISWRSSAPNFAQIGHEISKARGKNACTPYDSHCFHLRHETHARSTFCKEILHRVS